MVLCKGAQHCIHQHCLLSPILVFKDHYLMTHPHCHCILFLLSLASCCAANQRAVWKLPLIGSCCAIPILIHTKLNTGSNLMLFIISFHTTATSQFMVFPMAFLDSGIYYEVFNDMYLVSGLFLGVGMS